MGIEQWMLECILRMIFFIASCKLSNKSILGWLCLLMNVLWIVEQGYLSIQHGSGLFYDGPTHICSNVKQVTEKLQKYVVLSYLKTRSHREETTLLLGMLGQVSSLLEHQTKQMTFQLSRHHTLNNWVFLTASCSDLKTACVHVWELGFTLPHWY